MVPSDNHNYVMSGDFNGDGKMDVAITRPGMNGFHMRLSTVGGQFRSVFWPTDPDVLKNDTNPVTNPNNFDYNLIATGDLNGDGKTDIIISRPQISPNTPGTGYWQVRLSRANRDGFDCF